ncbi:MAG: PAS domain S-box protein, partial [Ignavibacteriales bacterium]|nr:PAS domain S-box protein [Ignavibacteriales bacterium]
MQLLNLFNGVIIGGFLISTGFSLYLWKNKIEKEINRAFSFLGIFITVYLLLTLLNYKHASPANFIIFDKLVNYTLLLCGLSLIILIRHITGYKNNTHPVVIYASFGILAIVNAIAPAGLSYASVSSMHPVILPWGEVIYSPVPQPSSFQYVVIGFIIYVLYFNIVAFKYAYKQGQKESINKVVWAVSFGLGSLALDNLLIMNGVYHLLFLDSLSFFFFIILIYQRNLASVIHSNKLQSELSENEKTMKFIIEGSNDGIWDWNMQSNKVKVSDRYLAMTGYSKAEFPEDMSAWLEIVHPEDKERLAGDLEKFFISDRKKTESEYRVITKQGSWMWINSRIFLAEAAEDGRPLRAIGSSSDITERKKAEEKTKRSEARFKTLAEATFEGIALVKDEIITDVNKQFCDLFGYGKKELQGKNIRELLNANSPAVSLDNMNVIGLAPFEIGGIRKDGSTVPLEIRSRTVLHSDGNLNVCIFRDLSFQKEAESALLQSEEKFRRLFEFSPTANIVVDQTPQHHIVAINKAGLLLLACDMQYALKHTLADFYGAQITGKIFSKIQQEGDLDKYEITITDKSDNGKIVNLYSRKVILGNEPTTFLLIDDITLQRHAEMRLSNSLTYIDSLVNSLPFGIISTDINLGVNTFNDAALQFLQAPEDMQNKYLFDKFKKLLFVQHKISIALLGQELIFEAVEYDEFTPSMDMTRHYSFSVIPLQFQLDPGYVIIIE